jgi:hypothetical protein
MYGLIGKMIAVPGQRYALIAVLLESVGEMPGCPRRPANRKHLVEAIE